MQEKTSADGPWELHTSGKQPGKRHFAMGHQAWVDREVAAPVGRGAKKAVLQCCDGHLWRKHGSCGPCGPAVGTEVAVLGHEVTGCRPDCPVPAETLAVQLDKPDFVQSAPKCRSSFLVFSF